MKNRKTPKYIGEKYFDFDVEYELIIPILLTILSDKLYEQLITICNVEIHSILYVLGEIVFMAVVVIVSVFLIKKITAPMYEKSFEKNFYLDYKKEIERILRERNPDIQL